MTASGQPLILIVDDNPQIRQTIRDVLENTCGMFIECADGQEAIEMCRLHRPHLILMDVRMPRLDGIAATREIMHTSPETRIIMVTHYDDHSLRSDAFRAGAIGYVMKDDLFVLHRLVGTTLANL